MCEQLAHRLLPQHVTPRSSYIVYLWDLNGGFAPGKWLWYSFLIFWHSCVVSLYFLLSASFLDSFYVDKLLENSENPHHNFLKAQGDVTKAFFVQQSMQTYRNLVYSDVKWQIRSWYNLSSYQNINPLKVAAIRDVVLKL